ncbi:MAG: hypothetical protein ACE15C_05355 [Phycisphaerae bacterium]
MRHAIRLALLASSTALLAGCPCPKAALPITVDQLVTQYNANAAAVPKLYARANLDINLVDDKGVPRFITLDGLLMLGKTPGGQDFVLRGSQSGTDVFKLGQNVQENVYYFWYAFGGKGKLWKGRLNLAGAEAVKSIPVDPTQLLSVLAVCELPSDLTKLPAVGLAQEPGGPGERWWCPPDTTRVGKLTQIDRQPASGRILSRSEMLFRWARDQSPRAFQVNILDSSGNRVMVATLKKYRTIKTAPDKSNQPAPATMPAFGPPPAPIMPSEIEVAWIGTGNRIRLTLSDMNTYQGKPEIGSKLIPPPGVEVIQVDEDIVAGPHESAVK